MHRVCLALLCGFEVCAASFDVRFQNSGGNTVLSWPGSLVSTSGAAVYPSFQVQQSHDLSSWAVVGRELKQAGSNSTLQLLVPRSQPHAFFRVLAQWPQVQPYALAESGAEVFGYTKAFASELERLGQISTDAFAAMYPPPDNYLSRISWDPTTAQYWDLFDTDPALHNIGLQPTNSGYRMYDFRLNTNELAILRQHGFVATKRLTTPHFSEAFYRLWNDDMPVFISTDALLHAWHRSYENMLIELEALWFTKVIGEILDAMAQQISIAQAEAPGPVFGPSLLDADYFITVGRSLLASSQKPSALGQDSRVKETLDAIAAESYRCFAPFGDPQMVDFSQFKPRGHYEHFLVQPYFKTMMWLARMDLRIGGKATDCDGIPYHVSPRQLGTAIVLTRVLELSGQFAKWQSLDKMLEMFVGWSDSLNVRQLSDLLHSSGINRLSDIPTAQALADLQARIEQSELGVQNIRGDVFSEMLGYSNLALPRSFTFMGQRFVLDSWALSQVVSPAVSWVTNGVRQLVNRRVISGVDVAFSVLHNDQVVPTIVERINNLSARTSNDHMIRWRDGYPYQHNLAAARNVVDQQSSTTWNGNIYIGWLGALRELSAPTTGAGFPDAMRTRAWAMRTLNTQIASWTQLRHDTLLYAKPTATDGGLCMFPDSYVEPRVEFWRRLEQMVRRTASLIQAAPYQGSFSSPWTGEIPMAELQTAQVNFLNLFASRVRTLGDIAEHELWNGRLTAAQIEFIDGMMQDRGMGYYNTRRFDGWYPKLYYKNRITSDSLGTWDKDYGSQKYDPLVVDVHTDVPRPDLYEDGHGVIDPGGVLHEAVGRVDLLYLVVNIGTERVMYAGPVMSHYEFEMPFAIRKTDTEWQADIANNRTPPPPPWTSTWLAP